MAITISFSPAALAVMSEWDWPGNVRELRNVIERAMIFADGAELDPSDLPKLSTLEVKTGVEDDGESFRLPAGLTLAGAEREYIQRTLAACDGSVQQTAEVLGISRKNLWEKRKKHGLLE